MNGTQVWCVGQVMSWPEDGGPSANWSFQGVFATEQEAIEACQGDNWFIGSVAIGERLPAEPFAWPGSYYPTVQEKPVV